MINEIQVLGNKLTELFAREILDDNEDLAYIMRYVLDSKMAFYKQFVTFNTYPNPIVLSSLTF
jgi:hypothetical protein